MIGPLVSEGDNAGEGPDAGEDIDADEGAGAGEVLLKFIQNLYADVPVSEPHAMHAGAISDRQLRRQSNSPFNEPDRPIAPCGTHCVLINASQKPQPHI